MTKYGNVRTQSFGRSFSSQGERDCFGYLTLLEKAGEIRDIECQVSVELTDARLRWVLDFKFFDLKLNETVWADFKGFETERWFTLKKLWPHYGPGRLRVFKGKGTRMFVAEEIVPKYREELK